jgi:methionyl-tRNA synthetase
LAQRKFITTPIYYINDRPHIGHAYTTIVADVLTRYSRLKGMETFFLTGTDEHGIHNLEAAQKANLDPQKFCDMNSALFKKAWKNLKIEYDYFVRTTDTRHEEAVKNFLERLYQSKTDKGEPVIYKGEYKGLYCRGCEKFITEKELVNGLCPDHQRKPEELSEKNYFFRLSAYLPQVKELILKDKIKILPQERRKEVLGLFKQKLEDFSISREKVTWGIPLPFDQKQKTYVWVEALQNYISAIGYGDNQKEFDTWWRKASILHLMAKDILKFHCIFWPALLLAAGEKPPEVIFLHGFFTVNKQRMSKTLGNVIDPNQMVKDFGVDGTRYLLLTQFPLGQDGDIQEKRFTEKFNSDLANDLGNLVSRVLKMVKSYCGGKIPQPEKYIQEDENLKNIAIETVKNTFYEIEKLNLNTGIDAILKLVRSTNKYVEESAPWNLAKQKNQSRLNTVLYSLRIISFLFYPLLPEKSRRIRKLLGIDDDPKNLSLENEGRWTILKPGTKAQSPESLFPRITKEIKLAPEKKEAPEGLPIEEFAKLDLRVAEVIQAERVPGTDKLLKLKINIGTEQRQIVAGIAQEYPPEKLSGKKIIVVTNLKPVKLRGVDSHGMLLAAEDKKSLALLTLDKDIEPGTRIS